VFEENRDVEPVYAQFLDLVETLEVVADRPEVSWGKVLADVDGEVASIRQQPVRGELR
jgi:hypothetical protein